MKKPKGVRVLYWLSCSKQTRMKTTVERPRGESREQRKDALDDWVDMAHPHCTGNMSYGWKYAR